MENPARVYEYGPTYRFFQTKLLEEGNETFIALKDYLWKLSYATFIEDKAEELQLSVDFESRYSFADKVNIEVSVEQNGKKVIKENCPHLYLMDRLELSDKYNLSRLQVVCLKELHEMNGTNLKIFLNTHRKQIRKLSHNTILNLI